MTGMSDQDGEEPTIKLSALREDKSQIKELEIWTESLVRSRRLNG